MEGQLNIETTCKSFDEIKELLDNLAALKNKPDTVLIIIHYLPESDLPIEWTNW